MGLPLSRRLGSERVEPLQQFHLAFPAWWSIESGRTVYFFQSLAFRFNAGSGVDVGGVEACMSQPAANHRDVNSCGDKTRCRGVAKRMRGDSLIRQGRNPLGSRRHVLPQLEAKAGSFERTSVPIDKHRFIFPAR